MLGLDGHRVLTELRHGSQTASIPVIFLTARTDQVAVSHGMAQSANAYIAKPFTIEEVLTVIRALVGD
jgi:DNA-binding response OmpR family regulator